MEKFANKTILEKLIVETDGQLKQSIFTERYFARKAAGKDNPKQAAEQRDQMQARISELKELLAFYEEIKPEYE